MVPAFRRDRRLTRSTKLPSRKSGLKGVVKAKLHYAWERNAVNNWQNDPLAPTSNVGKSTLIYMAYNNPNYNVHFLLAASLAYTW